MNKAALCLIIFLLSNIILQSFSSYNNLIYFENNISQPDNKSDSIVRKSHDMDYEHWIKIIPYDYQKMPEPNLFSNSTSPYPNINISRDSFPQNEPSVSISRSDPNRVVAAWRDFRTGVEPAVRRIGYSYSVDGGLTWAQSKLLDILDSAHPRASDPAVCVDTAGNFYISTISLTNTNSNGTVYVYKSTNQGVTFDQAFNIYPRSDTLYYDDKEYITCDLSPNSPFRNNLYVVWSSGNGNSLVRSTNGGLNWSDRVNVSNGGGGIGLVPAVGPNGEVFVTWAGGSIKGYGIYVNKSIDGGLSFGPNILIQKTSNSGFIIRLPSIAVDVSGGPRNGYIYAVWSNVYENLEDDEDVYFSFSSDGGTKWSIPKRINNDIPGNGKRQYFPWISVNNNGNISIIFFDSRNSSSLYIIETYLARSTNGGDSFTNELISARPFTTLEPNHDVRFGDYIGIDSWSNKIIPVWTDERTGNYNMEIYTASIMDSTVNITPIAQGIPDHFYLSQNYPNPFNPITKIKYQIVNSNFVELKVYNVLGKQVTTLVNQKQNAGTYTVDWPARTGGSAAGFPTGVYFYTITAGDFKQTKRMILLK
ncbi:MAG: T9SS type A sorting domain-containing protein [bacterium]